MPKTNRVLAIVVGLWKLAFLAAVSQSRSGPVVLQKASGYANNSGAANVGVTIHAASEVRP
jgi:hypothetical protein